MNSFDYCTTTGVEQLLGRRPHPPMSTQARQLIRGARVLVTGAGGSIGGELVRQIAALEPAALFLLDHDESHLHAIQLELFGDGQLDDERTVLADIRDSTRLKILFQGVRPDIVFHAAAHKHLSILERYPSEAVRTNTLGTQNVVDACVASNAERLIFVSTDKAAAPTSVLGATKNLAEQVVRAAASPTLLTASVRFGNVLGSRGSFLHTLAHQLRQGAPVTVTHPDVERYFMSIPEAASLVVEAGAMANAGEVYLLEMGEPVRILDLVRRFSRAAGMSMPKIRLVGLREGEKLSEDLSSASESWIETDVAKVWRVSDSDYRAIVPNAFARLYAAAARYDEVAVRRELALGATDFGRTACDAIPTGSPRVPAQRHVNLEAAVS